jgi:hypothetical protein
MNLPTGFPPYIAAALARGKRVGFVHVVIQQVAGNTDFSIFLSVLHSQNASF